MGKNAAAGLQCTQINEGSGQGSMERLVGQVFICGEGVLEGSALGWFLVLVPGRRKREMNILPVPRSDRSPRINDFRLSSSAFISPVSLDGGENRNTYTGLVCRQRSKSIPKQTNSCRRTTRDGYDASSLNRLNAMARKERTRDQPLLSLHPFETYTIVSSLQRKE